MEQKIIVYKKETKELIAVIKPESPLIRFEAIKVPDVEIGFTFKEDNLFAIVENKYIVNEKLLKKG